MDIVRETGGELTVAELTAKDQDGKSIIDYLVKNNQLDHLLQPRDWLGRGQTSSRSCGRTFQSTHATRSTSSELIGGLNTLALRDRFRQSPARAGQAFDILYETRQDHNHKTYRGACRFTSGNFMRFAALLFLSFLLLPVHAFAGPLQDGAARVSAQRLA